MGDVKRRIAGVVPERIRGPLRRRLRSWRKRRSLAAVDMGALRRTTPISRLWGSDRGRPVDRAYIEAFLERHGGDIRGRCLELGNDNYLRRFGSGVERTDVLHIEAGHAGVTIVGDLVSGDGLPSDTFDCIVLTQTLHEIYDVPAALRTLVRILRPGGVVLATAPGISGIIHPDAERWGDFWRFTTASMERLFADAGFDAEVRSYGNVLSSAAFLYGLASSELTAEELAAHDPDYQLVLTVRAARPASPPATPGD
jgi:SAM-dependent methyltransferase